jgi:hypothetical protein
MTTVKCERCRVDVPVNKLDLPDRCTDRECPLRQRPPEKSAP